MLAISANLNVELAGCGFRQDPEKVGFLVKAKERAFLVLSERLFGLLVEIQHQ